MTIFDGNAFAAEREAVLAQQVKRLAKPLQLVSVVFEDEASLLYTRKKQEAAERVGITFSPHYFSFSDDVHMVADKIRTWCADDAVTGLMVQKPSRLAWSKGLRTQSSQPPAIRYDSWWRMLTDAIDPVKDVDCLTQTNLHKIYSLDTSDATDVSDLILPATVKACLDILDEAIRQAQREQPLSNETITLSNPLSIALIGTSDLVGKPLAKVLEMHGHQVQLLGRKDDLHVVLPQQQVIISATGKANLIGADMVQPDAIVIDVGSPSSDVDFDTVKSSVSFITPVPGGVGPVTVVSLLENLVGLSE